MCVIFRSRWSAHICRTAGNGRICINGYRLCRPTDGRSLDHYAPHSRSFSIFFILFFPYSFFHSFFYQSPLSLWRFPCRTKERSSGGAELFQSLSKRHSVPFIVHIHTRCIVAFAAIRSLFLPPAIRSPLSPASPSSSLLHFRYSHRSALNSLYNARLSRARCRRTNPRLSGCGTTRPLRMQRMPHMYVPASTLRVLFARERNRRSLIRWRIPDAASIARCLDRGGSIRISVWIERIRMLAHNPYRSCWRWKRIDLFCHSKCFA